MKLVDLATETRRSVPFALRKTADELEQAADSRSSALVVVISPGEPIRIFSSGVEQSVPNWVGALEWAKFTLFSLQEGDSE